MGGKKRQFDCAFIVLGNNTPFPVLRFRKRMIASAMLTKTARLTRTMELRASFISQFTNLSSVRRSLVALCSNTAKSASPADPCRQHQTLSRITRSGPRARTPATAPERPANCQPRSQPHNPIDSSVQHHRHISLLYGYSQRAVLVFHVCSER